jgi:hypothetical protein
MRVAAAVGQRQRRQPQQRRIVALRPGAAEGAADPLRRSRTRSRRRATARRARSTRSRSWRAARTSCSRSNRSSRAHARRCRKRS